MLVILAQHTKYFVLSIKIHIPGAVLVREKLNWIFQMKKKHLAVVGSMNGVKTWTT